ncbi:MAG: response regulator [Anaerolineae bacterium]|nr:response regulator [Anaerolineae bacterium]
MVDKPVKLLLVEDDKVDRMSFERFVKHQNLPYDYTLAGSVAEGKAILQQNTFDIVLLDFQLGDGTSLELFDAVGSAPIVIITGSGDETVAVQALKAGAYDYLIKDPQGHYLMALPVTVDNAIRRNLAERELQEYRVRLESLVAERTRDLMAANERLRAEAAERQRIVDALQESENRYRSLFYNNHSVMLLIEPDTGVIVDANPAACVFYGYSHEELVGMQITNINTLSQEEVSAEMRAANMEQRQLFNFRHKLANNEVRDVEVYSGPIVIEDTQFLYSLVHDITKRRKAEAALQEERASLARRVEERTAELRAANAELERVGRLKDEFLANMSHELRTPLNAVLGMSEGLDLGVYGSLNLRQHNALRTIHKSGEHLLALINDILDVSKIEAGKLELDIETVPVDSVCIGSLAFIKQMAQEKGLRVSTVFDPAVQTLQADSRRLKQILVNLLSNAVKFTSEGGEIGLTVEGDAEHGVVHFIVWDTGAGIAPEKIGDLFQPFVQLDSRLTREHSGTGLGLTLVQRLAELHRGSVTLESAVGKGSRFTVSLPWQERYPLHQEPVVPDTVVTTESFPYPVVLDNARILLAEDNEANIEIMLDYLQAKGYAVAVARNGRQSLELASEFQPDLIIMDIQMPEMDGLEATRRIRQDLTLHNIPIIALTALVMPGDRERCLEAGVDVYFSKPVSLNVLNDKIIELLVHP